MQGVRSIGCISPW